MFSWVQKWYWTWIWSRNEHFRSFHWKTGKRRFWWIEGFQRANVDILYIKMMDFHRPSISRCEKRGFSLKNESWWKIGFSIGKMENSPKKRVCRGDEGPKLSWDVQWCPRIDLRSFCDFLWFSKNIAKIRAKKGGFGTLERLLAWKKSGFMRQKSDPRGVSGT